VHRSVSELILYFLLASSAVPSSPCVPIEVWFRGHFALSQKFNLELMRARDRMGRKCMNIKNHSVMLEQDVFLDESSGLASIKLGVFSDADTKSKVGVISLKCAKTEFAQCASKLLLASQHLAK